MKLKDRISVFLRRFHMKKLMVFFGVVMLCGYVTFAVLSWQPEVRTTTKEANIQVVEMPVSIRSIEPDAYPAVVKALGEVVPLWQTTMKTQVGGQIVFLSERLQAGNIVKQGELLVQIAKSNFAMQAAEAKSRLAAAKVTLLREEREAWEAQKNWEQSGIGGKPESTLVLRKPQLKAARSDRDAAQAAVAHAETLLGYTDIRAPYDGVIMRRAINQGETLFAGDEVATLYGMETVEVGIHLDAAQWALLPDKIQDAGVRLCDPQQQSTWEAVVVRQSRHLSRDSRLRTLVLQVKRPLDKIPPLLPGTFVRAEITGREIPNLLCIPESALTKQGLVWFVDRNNRLQRQRLKPVFYGEGIVYVPMPSDMEGPMQVAVSPNSSFAGGLTIQPITNNRGQ